MYIIKKYSIWLLIAASVFICTLLAGMDYSDSDKPVKISNSAAAVEDAESSSKVAAPVFSHESGFYDQELSLQITAPEGATIYYTLDSSEPGMDSTRYSGEIRLSDASAGPNVYSSRTDFGPYLPKPRTGYETEVADGWFSRNILPDNVDKCQVVRAMAVDKEGNQSDVVTASYFIGFMDKPGYRDISVLSLVSDPEDLFSDETGIMVNGAAYKEKWQSGALDGVVNSHSIRQYCNTYTGRGRQWERKVHMDYFSDKDQSLIFSQEAGIRLHGNQSRVAESQKSFNLYARKSYDGHSTFQAPFYENGLLQDRVTLMRGNDLRNYYLSEKMNGRCMDTQNYRMVQVFLDGEYWGIYAIQDRYNSDEYLKTHYNLGKDDYILAKGLPTGFDIKNGDPEAIRTSFREVRDFARDHDLSQAENYHELCDMMDMQSFIDGYAVRLYTGDQDWSWFKNQYMLFFDHKWHWLVFDIDYGAGKHEGPDTDTFISNRLNPNYSLANDPLFPYLMKNDSFRQRFVNTYMDLANETFNGAKIRNELNRFSEEYKEAGILESRRYPTADSLNRKDDPEYISELYQLCNDTAEYFENRFSFASLHLADYFGLTGTPAAITIENDTPEGGSIRLNTITPALFDSKEWTGSYYTDFPLTLAAVPREGWVFDGWEVEKGSHGEVKELSREEAELTFTGDVRVKGIFHKE